jgi:hypothetical protein
MTEHDLLLPPPVQLQPGTLEPPETVGQAHDDDPEQNVPVLGLATSLSQQPL